MPPAKNTFPVNDVGSAVTACVVFHFFLFFSGSTRGGMEGVKGEFMASALGWRSNEVNFCDPEFVASSPYNGFSCEITVMLFSLAWQHTTHYLLLKHHQLIGTPGMANLSSSNQIKLNCTTNQTVGFKVHAMWAANRDASQA
eukprot:280055-Pelagomonas_calceolata.AAC.2